MHVYRTTMSWSGFLAKDQGRSSLPHHSQKTDCFFFELHMYQGGNYSDAVDHSLSEITVIRFFRCKKYFGTARKLQNFLTQILF